MRGGKRLGAGRKPKPESRVVGRSIKVSREVETYLQEVGTGVIEPLIRGSDDFQGWRNKSDAKNENEGEK